MLYISILLDASYPSWFLSLKYSIIKSINIETVYRAHFVFPFKFCPHLAELSIGTSSGLDVIHDVNVYVTKNHTVSITGCSRNIIY